MTLFKFWVHECIHSDILKCQNSHLKVCYGVIFIFQIKSLGWAHWGKWGCSLNRENAVLYRAHLSNLKKGFLSSRPLDISKLILEMSHFLYQHVRSMCLYAYAFLWPEVTL